MSHATEWPDLSVDVPCHHCGRMVTVVVHAEAQLVHVLPTCAVFDAVETVDEGTAYVRRCREAISPS